MRNLLIFREESLHFPRTYFGAQIPPNFAPICAGFERRANCRLHRGCGVFVRAV